MNLHLGRFNSGLGFFLKGVNDPNISADFNSIEHAESVSSMSESYFELIGGPASHCLFVCGGVRNLISQFLNSTTLPGPGRPVFCRFWLPLLVAASGCRFWLPLLVAASGCQPSELRVAGYGLRCAIHDSRFTVFYAFCRFYCRFWLPFGKAKSQCSTILRDQNKLIYEFKYFTARREAIEPRGIIFSCSSRGDRTKRNCS
jgi:hypothetical protein